MTADVPAFEVARQVADAVLYEGYLLYPYRASAQKNRMRWQFGVLVPKGQSEAAGEPWTAHAELLLDAAPGATVRVRVRCLHLKTPEAGPDEGRESSIDVTARSTRGGRSAPIGAAMRGKYTFVMSAESPTRTVLARDTALEK